MYPSQIELARGDRRTDLTRTEWLSLELLLCNAECVLRRDVIHERVRAWTLRSRPAAWAVIAAATHDGSRATIP